jgi:hypothetical protein
MGSSLIAPVVKTGACPRLLLKKRTLVIFYLKIRFGIVFRQVFIAISRLF